MEVLKVFESKEQYAVQFGYEDYFDEVKSINKQKTRVSQSTACLLSNFSKKAQHENIKKERKIHRISKKVYLVFCSFTIPQKKTKIGNNINKEKKSPNPQLRLRADSIRKARS